MAHDSVVELIGLGIVVIGVAALVGGLWMISEALAVIVAGLSLLTGGLFCVGYAQKMGGKP